METEFIKKRKIIAVVGKTGYGKSYFVKQFAKDINRIVIFDTQGEYDASDNFDVKDFEYVDDFETFIDILKESDYDKDLKLVLCYDAIEDYEDSLEAINIVGSMTVLLEEVHNYASARDIHPDLEQMIRTGRHRDISIIAVSQRFHDLNLILRNNLDGVVAFNISAPNDLEYLAKVPFIADKAEEIGKLERYEKLIFLNSD